MQDNIRLGKAQVDRARKVRKESTDEELGPDMVEMDVEALYITASILLKSPKTMEKRYSAHHM